MTKKYEDTEFLTAKQKEKIEKDWGRFMNFLAEGKHLTYNETAEGSDYGTVAPKEFSKALYNHLHLHCGYIAHYNQHGFYDTYFTGDIKDLEQFFKNFSDYKNSAVIWGDYKDIGETMVEIYEKYKAKIFATAEVETDDKFELIKECVKRAETDLDFRKQIVSEFLG